MHTLEVGYAIHELAFAALLIAIVAVPLRLRQPWAWVLCWVVLTADIGYAGGFGAYDTAILRQSLIAAIGTAVALLALAPAVSRRRRERPSA